MPPREFTKRAFEEGRIEALRRLGAEPWYGALDRLGLPDAEEAPGTHDPVQVQAQISQARDAIAKRYGVTPRLAGSLPLKLNIPGEMDVDFTVPIRSTDKFRRVTKSLSGDPRFQGSPYNRDGTGHFVFTAPEGTFGPLPVDVAVSHGEHAAQFAKALKERQATADALPEDVRNALVERKRVLKHTPFDIGGKRYKAFKRELNRELTGGKDVELRRRPLEEKTARVLDPANEKDNAELEAFLANPALHGHRTPHAEQVLSTGKLMSGLEALRRGHLTTYESGYIPGMRSKFEIPKLSKTQLDTLTKAWLKETPDYAAIDALGHPRDALKGALVRDRFSAVDRYLRQTPDGEEWRKEHLRIPKLSPHVFLTEGGLLKNPGYGDVGILAHTPKAETSPFLTLINRESILAPSSGLRSRGIDPKKGLVVSNPARIKELEAQFPEYTYVPEEAVYARGLGYENTRSLDELARRVVPRMLDGTLDARQG